MFQLRKGLSELRAHREQVSWFVLDLAMVILALSYLAWTLVDYLVRTKVFARLLAEVADASVVGWYERYTHYDSFYYEVLFISVFLAELLLRWAVAIWRKTYDRWFFYPFVHWYDTLGCIPIDAFKFFRMVRVVAIGYKLHRLKVIDLSNTYFFKKGAKYLNILVEEVSDRVVVNVLSGFQGEIEKGNPVTDRIFSEVIKPRKSELVDFVSHRIQLATASAHVSYQADIKEYVDGLIEQAVDENKEINTLEKIPVVGRNISGLLESAISDIVFRVVNQALRDLGSEKNKELLGEIADIAFESVLLEEEDVRLNQIAKDMATQSLEIVKEQVLVKQWKQSGDLNADSTRETP